LSSHGRSPKEVIKNALGEGRLKLLEHEAFELIRYYGMPIPETVFLRTAKEAYELADTIGYPIVVKVVSPDIIHKSDVEGVRLGLKSREEVVQAVEWMRKTIPSRVPHARIVGFLIQSMVPPSIEVIVGGIRDDVFGPAITFGLGGIFVEVLRDASFRIAPVSIDEAFEMINEVKARRILEGYRGQGPADKKAIADIIVNVGRLMIENEEVESIDLNPVIVYSKGAMVVDVRIILGKPPSEQGD